MVMPTGIAGTAFTTNDVSLTIARKRRLTRIFDGRLAINPPVMLPKRSAIHVAEATRIPATKKDITTRITNRVSIAGSTLSQEGSGRGNNNHGSCKRSGKAFFETTGKKVLPCPIPQRKKGNPPIAHERSSRTWMIRSRA